MIKLKQLMNCLDSNPIFLTSREDCDLDRRLLYAYKKAGWIDAIGRGAFIRHGIKPTFLTGINALQQQTAQLFHLGGLSVLNEVYGIRHYLRDGIKYVLYTSGLTPMPSWFSKLYSGKYEYVKSTFLPDCLGVQEVEVDGYKILASTPERAFLEMLQSKQCSTIESFQILEMLTVLRPKVLNELLINCRSVRVKRLFCYLASHLNYAWVSKLSLDEIDFGSGVRVIDSAGKHDTQYNLIVQPIGGEA